FDGFNDTLAVSPIDNGAQLAGVTQLGVQALRQAVDVVKDPDFIDINLLAIPGIYSNQVVEYGIEKIETRADAMYVIDISGSTYSIVANEVKSRGFNTSYATVYYPDINVVDDVNGKIVRVPSSVAAVGAISFNDRVSFPWFAPAGLNRGGLNADTIGFAVTKPVDQLKESERNTLYENRVNPIAKFPGIPGATIWGQKTLQVKASALDRVNVRRLLIKAKKLVSSAVKFLVFEPNNPSTWTAFKQIVNPILADIQSKNGLEQFQVIIDSTTNTPDLIDRNVMRGVLLLIPQRSAEFIAIDFVIGRSGASFQE
ncbi:MAG: phage tail sheath C-terminal domain-containing protein, partial [Nanoarchaeota archaeon]